MHITVRDISVGGINMNISLGKDDPNIFYILGSFKIEAESFREFYDALKVLINSVSGALEKIVCNCEG